MTPLLIYSALVMIASLSGVATIWYGIGKFVERNSHFLVSFSAGVFLVISYYLGIEVLGHSRTTLEGIAWILVGGLGIWLLFKFLPTFHHHHDSGAEDKSHDRLDARRIIVGDAIHNLGDGILLASSFAVSASLGAVTALSVFIHELVQEMSEFFVLKQAGYSTRRALTLNLAISSTILIGAIGGFYLLDTFAVLEVPILGIASGSFLVVVIHDLIPHSIRTSRNNNLYSKHLLWFILGIILMFMINSLVVH